MISYPLAKINIGLNIVERRQDGFHNIESVFYPIPLCDILEINLSNDFAFSASGLVISGNVKDNLIVKAFNLLKKEFSIANVSIHLHKQIPMGAGLGGGSSDAAATLNMLNQLFELNLSVSDLEKYALTLGSDCPFFIASTPKFVTGVGEKMAAIAVDLKGKYLYLINPDIHVSTKEAYAGVIPKVSQIDLFKTISGKNIQHWTDLVKNDFENSIFRNHPKLKSIKELIYAEGAIYTSMSGSGSTIYGIFNEVPTLNGQFDFEKILWL